MGGRLNWDRVRTETLTRRRATARLGSDIMLTPAARKAQHLRRNQLETLRKVLEMRRNQLETATRETSGEPLIRITKSRTKKRFREPRVPDWHLNSDK